MITYKIIVTCDKCGIFRERQVQKNVLYWMKKYKESLKNLGWKFGEWETLCPDCAMKKA